MQVKMPLTRLVSQYWTMPVFFQNNPPLMRAVTAAEPLHHNHPDAYPVAHAALLYCARVNLLASGSFDD